MRGEIRTGYYETGKWIWKALLGHGDTEGTSLFDSCWWVVVTSIEDLGAHPASCTVGTVSLSQG